MESKSGEIGRNPDFIAFLERRGNMEIKKILDKSDELFAKGKSQEGCEYLEDSLKTARSESDWASQLTITEVSAIWIRHGNMLMRH